MVDTMPNPKKKTLWARSWLNYKKDKKQKNPFHMCFFYLLAYTFNKYAIFNNLHGVFCNMAREESAIYNFVYNYDF